MNDKIIKLNENTKHKIKINAEADNLHVRLRGGVLGVIDSQTGEMIIERSKRCDKKDVRSVFGKNSIFTERCIPIENFRTSLSSAIFDDPNNENWSDWSYS